MKKKKAAFNFRAYLKNQLRRLSYRFPQHNGAYALSRVGIDKYRCAHCKKIFSKKLKQTVVDHISPVVPITGWDSWDGVIERLFFGARQVLCKPCHKVKSLAENKKRRDNDA